MASHLSKVNFSALLVLLEHFSICPDSWSKAFTCINLETSRLAIRSAVNKSNLLVHTQPQGSRSSSDFRGGVLKSKILLDACWGL